MNSGAGGEIVLADNRDSQTTQQSVLRGGRRMILRRDSSLAAKEMTRQ
jgi:hypothetical protein